MTPKGLQDLYTRYRVHDLNERAEVEQFHTMSTDDKLLWMFFEMKELKRSRARSFTERLMYDFGPLSLILGYFFFDQRPRLP